MRSNATFMNRLWIWLLGALCCLGARTPEPAAAKPVDPCKLQGAVYVVQVASFADYRVFVQDVEAFADLVVYKEDAQVYADRPGHWYLTDVRGFADFTIFVEDVEAFADFSIAYTPFRSAAGCQP
jgi:hypothetical protein